MKNISIRVNDANGHVFGWYTIKMKRSVLTLHEIVLGAVLSGLRKLSLGTLLLLFMHVFYL